MRYLFIGLCMLLLAGCEDTTNNIRMQSSVDAVCILYEMQNDLPEGTCNPDAILTAYADLVADCFNQYELTDTDNYADWKTCLEDGGVLFP